VRTLASPPNMTLVTTKREQDLRQFEDIGTGTMFEFCVSQDANGRENIVGYGFPSRDHFSVYKRLGIKHSANKCEGPNASDLSANRLVKIPCRITVLIVKEVEITYKV